MKYTGRENEAVLQQVTETLLLSDVEIDLSPVKKLAQTLAAQLRNAVDAAQSDLLTYESLRNVSEVIGGEYGDRVIFELVQNAHDAHVDGEEGAILLKLVIDGPDQANLYVANMGKGFSWENVNAIRNVGVSSKSVGEGIGNKGLGFRSVETLPIFVGHMEGRGLRRYGCHPRRKSVGRQRSAAARFSRKKLDLAKCRRGHW